ncbi:uncharacterized protein VICG_00070 [Vittaforma corneae ATCC 50505]|uniref:Uncharacterized protein n=1 Tax=Vittaforma corneae (strain ATCC 50505) TaxID=993615 RepID=L2GQG9_VITCO|nr:uncharacterized protein VICG_00070 [Vittaforma corneae ATCC 50505]ELA42755.1 hypothetical protein VICG_00070 [Vittaforma corneae ATCC 50505]
MLFDWSNIDGRYVTSIGIFGRIKCIHTKGGVRIYMAAEQANDSALQKDNRSYSASYLSFNLACILFTVLLCELWNEDPIFELQPFRLLLTFIFAAIPLVSGIPVLKSVSQPINACSSIATIIMCLLLIYGSLHDK